MIRKALLAALALACAALTVAAPIAALAQAAPTPQTTAVVIPWGDWLSAALSIAAPTAVTVLAGVASAGIAKVAPWLAVFISQRRIEITVQTAVAYGINAVEGATKGEKLSVPVGSAVVAKALQRVSDSTPAWIIKAAGGLPEIGARIFRSLDLVPEATAANVLAPAQAAIQAR